MSKYLWADVEFVNIQKERGRMRVFINHCPHLRGPRMQSTWTSYWGFQEHKEGLNQYLWWWIDFPK
jgi:hypothetical protein